MARFVVAISSHDERLGRIFLPLKLMLISLASGILGSVSLLHQWQKEKEERHKKELKKKILLVAAYRNVGCRSLSAYSQPIC